jgi:polysaccharide pyruvyl transferase WcaK-like protein
MTKQGRRDFLKKSGLGLLPLAFGSVAAANALNVPANTSNAPGDTSNAAANPLIAPSKKRSASKTVLLRSSWNDYNVGDIGHTPGTLRLLERYIPDAEILLWHAAPRPITEALVAKYFPKVKIVRGLFSEGDSPLNGELKEAFDKANMYIHNSGMSFNYGLFNYNWDGMIGLLAPMLYCYNNKIPFGPYGQSFDKMAPPSMLFYRDVLDKAAFVYCRDKNSLAFVKENAFNPRVLEFAPDGCFRIDVIDHEAGLRYLQANKLEKGKFLAVNIRTNTSKDGKTGDLMNPNSTPEKLAEDRARLDKVKAMITYWVKNTGQRVLIFPEAVKEGLQGKIQLYDSLDADIKPHVVCREEWWTNADETMGILQHASVVFGMEPHTLIMALTLGVPILHASPVSNGRKGWMFRDIGLPEWLFDIDVVKADELVSALSTIVKNYPMAKAKVKAAMAVVEERQRTSMNHIKASMP